MRPPWHIVAEKIMSNETGIITDCLVELKPESGNFASIQHDATESPVGRQYLLNSAGASFCTQWNDGHAN